MLEASSITTQHSPNNRMHVHLHKVPADTGIVGNECSNEYTKLGCTEPENARVVEMLPDRPKVVVIKDQTGRGLQKAQVDDICTAQRKETLYAWSAARRVQQCQAGMFATGEIRYRHKRQHTPHCVPCRNKNRGDHVSDIAHMLGGCPESEMRSLHNKRHDCAVELIAQAIASGYKG
eukprot:1874673-Pyramimonas_sp.AAC.1